MFESAVFRVLGFRVTYSLHRSSFFWFNQLYIKDFIRYPQQGTTMETTGNVSKPRSCPQRQVLSLPQPPILVCSPGQITQNSGILTTPQFRRYLQPAHRDACVSMAKRKFYRSPGTCSWSQSHHHTNRLQNARKIRLAMKAQSLHMNRI